MCSQKIFLNMKVPYIFTIIICAAWAYPKDNILPPFKRLYVDPIEPRSIPLNLGIVNGHEAVPHSIPYQAYIVITGSVGKWSCGGVLIATQFVLTAAHCLSGGDSALVYLGAHDVEYKENSQIRMSSSRLIIHEEFYEYTASNDIGLIELSEPVTLNNYVGLAELPYIEDENTTFKGENARFSGWGFTGGFGSNSAVLLEANATVIENRLCHAIYGIVQDSQLCTGGDGGVTSCGGDSGGPLVLNNKLIGIVSYSVKDCVTGFPSGYTRISSYLEWIQSHSDIVVI